LGDILRSIIDNSRDGYCNHQKGFMNYYKQTDFSDQLGTCNTTIKRAGCFVTSLAMISGKTPPEVNNLLRDNGGFKNGCNMISDKAAEILGLEYNGKSSTLPEGYDPVIAETNYYKNSGTPQHFFVISGGKRYDPLGKNINYPIVSYRLFKKKESEENVNHEVIAETVRKVRKMVLTGTFDNAGCEADITWVENELNKGNKYAFEQLFGRYERAGNFIGKADCQTYIDKLNTAKNKAVEITKL
jgi:hypothetical protein